MSRQDGFIYLFDTIQAGQVITTEAETRGFAVTVRPTANEGLLMVLESAPGLDSNEVFHVYEGDMVEVNGEYLRIIKADSDEGRYFAVDLQEAKDDLVSKMSDVRIEHRNETTYKMLFDEAKRRGWDAGPEPDGGLEILNERHSYKVAIGDKVLFKKQDVFVTQKVQQN